MNQGTDLHMEIGEQFYQGHVPVMMQEVLKHLVVNRKGNYLDGTFGQGGHSQSILNALDPEGKLYACDKDISTLSVSEKIDDPRFKFFHQTFSQIHESIQEPLDGILLDLGISSVQLDDETRGFSFSHEGPLDMRMDTNSGKTALEWLTKNTEKTIADVIYFIGDEGRSRRIAKEIKRWLASNEPKTTKALADLVTGIYPPGHRRQHPATKTFLAIRTVINDELEEIKRALPSLTKLLKTGGRLVVLSFQSNEDALIKRFMKSGSFEHQDTRVTEENRYQLPESNDDHRPLKQLGKPLKPSKEEIKKNPRSRSTILRMAEKKPEKKVYKSLSKRVEA